MIKVNNLNKYYNKGKSNQIHVIDNTSLELPSKGLITFLGHSGSGKTTLLNVIGGLDKATGEITYDDTTFKNYSVSKIDKFRSKNIGYVFQNYNLLLEETVYDNLRIALDLIGITDLDEQKKRIEYSLKAVGMYKYRKKVASFLSGGQQQRVSIARALVKKSKIIIADEPTGNLDSKNTMEVMNILKKISEQALVLLVTHEENVANFYSDLIYEIKDGRIIDKKEVSESVTFNHSDESTIYLKDLKEEDYKTELGNITIHSDSDEPLEINFDLIIKNGNIYLKTDKPIKLLEQANIKIVNDNFKEMKREDISTFNYDTSWYNDAKGENRAFKKALKRIVNSFISFKAVGKKQKFLYICLGFIGAIMAIAFALLSNVLSFDISNSPYSEKLNTIEYLGEYRDYRDDTSIEDAYNAGEISDLFMYSNAIFEYSETVLYNYSIDIPLSVMFVPYYDYNVELVEGEKPSNNNEIVISADIAQRISDKTKRSNKEILGKKVTLSNVEYTIKGISKKDNLMVYTSLQAYEDLQNGVYYSGIKGYTYEYKIGDTTYITRYDMRMKQYEEYQIVEGRDVDLEASEIEAVVSSSSGLAIGDNIYLNGEDYAKIVGYYSYNKFGGNYVAIINKEVKLVVGDYYDTIQKFAYENSENIKLIEGTYPKGKNEVLIPIYFDINANVGDEIELPYGRGKKKVVGKCTGRTGYSTNYIVSPECNLLDRYYSNVIGFNINNRQAFESRLKNANIALMTLKDSVVAEQKSNKQAIVDAFIIVFTVTAIASSIFVYFVMRSKMISDIYSIGVYRSLGASRSRINRKYLSDILILTTLTGLIGYIFGALGYILVVNGINAIFGEIANAQVLMINGWCVLLGIFALYSIMYIFGMLPIIMLERKTPSEIIAKYDI